MNIFDKEVLYNINFIFSLFLDKIEKFLNNLNTKSYFMKKIINEINEKNNVFFILTILFYYQKIKKME